MWRRRVSGSELNSVTGAMAKSSHTGFDDRNSGTVCHGGGRRVCPPVGARRACTRENGPVTGFPLLLDLHGRRAVVVGGGVIAARRVAALVGAGADVVVVTLETVADIRGLDVTVTQRAFRATDLDGAWLAFACTSSPDVNAEVAAAALERRIFCARADDASGGTARTPAVAHVAGVTVAVNGGDDPRRAQALRDAIAAALDAGDLPIRRHRRSGTGSVALVGGGPGDPQLITVRGRRLIAEADVIVVDRLAPRELLTGLPDDVEVIDCGKSAHRHNLRQDDINQVLVDRARAGKRVVRLKGATRSCSDAGARSGSPASRPACRSRSCPA